MPIFSHGNIPILFVPLPPLFRTLEATRQYDVVREVTNASLAPYGVCLGVLALHALIALAVMRRFVSRSTST